MTSSASLWLETVRGSLSSLSESLYSAESKREKLVTSAELNLYQAQLIRLLLTCSANSAAFCDYLSTAKWGNLLISSLKSRDHVDDGNQALLTLISRLAGTVLPRVNPTDQKLAVTGSDFVSHLIQMIGKLVVSDNLLEHKSEKDIKEKEKEKEPETKAVVKKDVFFFARLERPVEGEPDVVFDLRVLNREGAFMIEMVELYRQLFSDIHFHYGDDWRALTLKYLVDGIKEISNPSALSTTLAALAVLGGAVEPLRVGGRVQRRGQSGTITKVVWKRPNPKNDEQKKLFKEMSSLLYSVDILMDSGDKEQLIGNQTKNLAVEPLVSVPYHRIKMSAILQSLAQFVFVDQKRLSVSGRRQKIVSALLSRQAMKVVSTALARPALAATFQPWLDALAASARTPCVLPNASLLALEERSRALDLFDLPALEDQAESTQDNAAGAAGASAMTGGDASFSLSWKTDSKCQNVRFTEDDCLATFNGNSSHRGIIAAQGISLQ